MWYGQFILTKSNQVSEPARSTRLAKENTLKKITQIQILKKSHQGSVVMTLVRHANTKSCKTYQWRLKLGWIYPALICFAASELDFHQSVQNVGCLFIFLIFLLFSFIFSFCFRSPREMREIIGNRKWLQKASSQLSQWKWWAMANLKCEKQNNHAQNGRITWIRLYLT